MRACVCPKVEVPATFTDIPVEWWPLSVGMVAPARSSAGALFHRNETTGLRRSAPASSARGFLDLLNRPKLSALLNTPLCGMTVVLPKAGADRQAGMRGTARLARPARTTITHGAWRAVCEALRAWAITISTAEISGVILCRQCERQSSVLAADS